MAHIYYIKCTETNIYYVGSTTVGVKRFSQHKALLRKGTHHSPYLQNSWNKYGENSFLFEMIEECPEDEILIREQYYIDALDSKYNYAKVAGSRKGVPQSQETKDMVSQSLLGNKRSLGRKHPEEEKQRRADSCRGQTRTPEQRANMSAAMTGVPHPNAVGHIVSEETRLKIKQATDATRPTMLGKQHREDSKFKSIISNKIAKAQKFGKYWIDLRDNAINHMSDEDLLRLSFIYDMYGDIENERLIIKAKDEVLKEVVKLTNTGVVVYRTWYYFGDTETLYGLIEPYFVEEKPAEPKAIAVPIEQPVQPLDVDNEPVDKTIYKGKNFKPLIKQCLFCKTDFETGGRNRPKKSALFCSANCQTDNNVTSGDVKQMDATEIKWFASIFDQFGNITYPKPNKKIIRLTVSYDPQKLINVTGTGSSGKIWVSNGKIALQLLQTIHPLLSNKKAIADMALKAQ
jgi:hypothetical protein